MDVKLRGHSIRTQRAKKIWHAMYADYRNKENPLTVEQIAEKYRKENGQKYSRQYIYKAFKKL